VTYISRHQPGFKKLVVGAPGFAGLILRALTPQHERQTMKKTVLHARGDMNIARQKLTEQKKQESQIVAILTLTRITKDGCLEVETMRLSAVHLEIVRAALAG
jgi:hypothetical protein